MEQVEQQRLSRALIWALLLSIALFAIYTYLPYLFPSLTPIEMTGFSLQYLSKAITHISILYVVILTLFLVRFEKGTTFISVFAFRPVKLKTIILWLLFTLLYVYTHLSIRHWIGIPVYVWWEKHLYDATQSSLIIIIAMTIAAPLIEELLFRGFIFGGLLNAGLGSATTILLTSYLSSIVISQYGIYDGLTVFIASVLFGYARARTKSVVTPLAMHMLFNFIESLALVLAITHKAIYIA